jgi:phosphoglycerate dehydrogenase-like enzyme
MHNHVHTKILKKKEAGMKKVLVTGSSIEQQYLDQLHNKGFYVENPQEHLTEEQLIEALKDAHIYLLGGLERATEDVLLHAPMLEHIAFLGVGYQSFIALERATALGIAVTNTPGTMINSVAELTIGHLIGLRRQIASFNSQAKAGQTIERKSVDLYGQTAGIIGMGSIGSRVAEMLVQGLGMKVLYYSPSPKPHIDHQLGARQVSLEELLCSSDVISIHAPLTSDTKDLLGTEQLAMIQPHGLIICTARVEIINGYALYNALSRQELGGAAFDGYYIEPMPTAKEDKWGLLSLADSVFIVTPHIASLTHNSWDKMAAMATSSIISFSETGNDHYLVNPRFREYKKGRTPKFNE